MKNLYIFIMIIISISEFAQEVQNDSIYSISEVDKKPEFIGGVSKFNRFIVSNFRYGVQRKFYGKIITEFVIEKDGSLSNFKTTNDFGYGSGAEAIRVLKLSPNWLPAEKNGKIVRSIYIFPLEINKSK